jgi:hypothetical protein
VKNKKSVVFQVPTALQLPTNQTSPNFTFFPPVNLDAGGGGG